MALHHTTGTNLRIGAWSVSPASGQIFREGETVRVEARAMRLLLCLAERPGEVVSIDDLLKQGWPDVIVTPDSVYQAVASLRRLLRDDPKQPTYIATVPRLGYRLVAPVSHRSDQPVIAGDSSPPPGPLDEPSPASGVPMSTTRHRVGVLLATGLIISIAIVIGFLFHSPIVKHDPAASAVASPHKSIAVLPFLDLTEGMTEEYFADGMTEEIIARLSKTPDVRVLPPTSSLPFNETRTAIADIARQLDVNYVLAGSVRKSGERVRVAARLIHANNGFVVWSETYDRPFDDILMVQDDIAGKVTQALQRVGER